MATYVLMFVNDESFRDRSKEEVAAVYAEITRWSDDLERKGILKGGVELQPKRTATTVRRVNGSMRVSDGPFIESKEHVGGFAMIEVSDLDEAIRIAKAFPGGVEVRPIVVH
ncbi:MAG TPA: YciI family protein [Candidatus Limnocylindria bacterium]|nr:YciI family protein [Candidatus Limnocylindria bacterium]